MLNVLERCLLNGGSFILKSFLGNPGRLRILGFKERKKLRFLYTLAKCNVLILAWKWVETIGI